MSAGYYYNMKKYNRGGSFHFSLSPSKQFSHSPIRRPIKQYDAQIEGERFEALQPTRTHTCNHRYNSRTILDETFGFPLKHQDLISF